MQPITQHAKVETVTPRESFFRTIDEFLDRRIGEAVYVPLFEAALRGCEVQDWKKEADKTYRLVLKSGYIAKMADNSGKTWYLEKEILCQFVPEHFQIVLPDVLKWKNSGEVIDPENKKMNAIWAWETHLGSVYTGVGYSIRWDSDYKQIVTDNINDAPWWLQYIAATESKSVEEAVKAWNERVRIADSAS